MNRRHLVICLALASCKPGGQGNVDDSKSGPGACGIEASVPDANPDSTPVLHRAEGPFSEARFRMRALEVSAPGGATLTIDGDVAVFDASGAESSAIPAANGPQTLFLQGLEHGAATVTLGPVAGCTTEPVSVELEVRRAVDLAGRPVLGAPGFSFADVFNADEVLSIAIDGRDAPDRVGQPFDAFVVTHRTPAEWADDPSLADVADGPVSGAIGEGSRDEEQIALWSGGLDVARENTTADYDIVLDFDGDGALGPGDWIDGLERPGFTAVRDLAGPGPYDVKTQESSTSFWATMRIYSPTSATPEPAPLVVISHGNGHDYTWYDYLGEHFASWGYVVISHRNDTEPGPVTAATTTLLNTQAFLEGWPSLGLAVEVDPHRIGWIGHSRGGEGVVIAYHELTQGVPEITAFEAADVKLVQSIAPTLFEGPGTANPHDVPYHLLAGSADGDVTGGTDSPMLQYFRIFQNGTGPHWVTYVQGADHNNFNCCGPADGTWFTVQGNPPLIGRERAQDVAKSYLLALLEREIMGHRAPADFLGRSPEQLAPIAVDAVVATQSMPAKKHTVIDDFQSRAGMGSSSSGGLVEDSGLLWGEGDLDDGNTSLAWNSNDQANGFTWSNNDANSERGAVIQWDSGEDGWIAWEVLDEDSDWTNRDELSLRACQTTRHPNTVALDDWASFSVELEDADGNAATVEIATYGRLTPPYPRGGLGSGKGWVNEFQTIRIPLEDFRAGADRVDLSRVATIRLRFGADWGSEQGRIGLDDLEVVTR